MDILRKFIGKRSQTKTAPQVLREPAQSNYIWTRHNISYADIKEGYRTRDRRRTFRASLRNCGAIGLISSSSWSHIDVNSQTRCHPVVYEMINLFLYDFNSIFFFESHEDDGCNAICCKIKRTLVKIFCVFMIYFDLFTIFGQVVSTPLKNISKLGLFFPI